MSFDGTMVRAVVHELSAQLSGGRISKIYHPTEYELLFTIRAKGQNHTLLLSANPAHARLHLTKWNPEKPQEPPMFCMHLRKHLEGGIIREIRQIDMERVIVLDIQTRNELGDDVGRQLIIETMGRHSNIILIEPESNRILDAIRRVPHSVSQVRQILPGLTYKLPPSQNKSNPLTVTKEKFLSSLDFNRGRIDRQIMSLYTGIGPIIAREMVARTALGNQENYWQAFDPIQKQLTKHQYQPTLVEAEQKTYFAIIELSIEGKKQTFSSVSSLLDHVYLGKTERDRNRQITRELVNRLHNEWEKNRKKIAILQEELQEVEKAEQYKLYGELLTVYLHQIKRGDREAQVNNYYDPDGAILSIPLDPQKSPSENAQAYYKKYQKVKAKEKWNHEQIAKAEEENHYLENVLVQLEQATQSELEEIQEELVEEGWLKPIQKKGRKRKKSVPLPSSFTASDGTTILVGKNNKQNDYLTHRLAKPDDLWLHTKDIPGSHVVIRQYNGSEETLREAANLAAYFSKARQSNQVPVDYTRVRYVKKPNGAKPGFTIYTHQQTIYITPDEEVVQKMAEKQ